MTIAVVLAPVLAARFGSIHAPEVHAKLAQLEKQYTERYTPASEVDVAGLRELVRSLRHRERIQLLQVERNFMEDNGSVMGLTDFGPLKNRAESINTVLKVYFEEAVQSMDALDLPDATRANHRDLITAHWHHANYLERTTAAHIRAAFEPQEALA